MTDPVTINLRHVARGLSIPLRQVEAVVELLDEGNTVPFITRYRKDQTGGLDEEQIRQIQSRLTKMRMLAERKQTILRSIEAQGKLSEKLAKQILAASTTKRLEDLYLPFKPKKQTLATTARGRGLELLATEILSGGVGAADLDARAADFVNPDRQVPTAADALLGAGHILAEQLSESAELRQRLREILHRTGKIVCSQVAPEPKVPAERPEKPVAPAEAVPAAAESALQPARAALTETTIQGAAVPPSLLPQTHQTASPSELAEAPAEPQSEVVVGIPAPEEVSAQIVGESKSAVEAGAVDLAIVGESQPAATPEAAGALAPLVLDTGVSGPASAWPPGRLRAVRSQAPSPHGPAKPSRAEQKREKKEQKKKKAEQRKQKAFSDYYSYSEEIKRIPPHRVLAINRGERARVLRVKIECDIEAMHQAVDEVCVPPDHPHAEFLRGCARDALVRLVLPSLEREIRRELTERAETHAVGVFARNLRNLLLQPPVRDRRVLAVDPGFKSGCKLVALDQFGSVLAHDVVYLVGKPERREEAKRKAADLIQRFALSVATIGNGTACREAESFFAELIGSELRDKGVSFVIVNEAGASVYSTSRIGREELPHYDASLRGAISIGRRLQDPLSELVKIDPANIGVGLYQHDVKAKHLRDSLDEVVESCVNYVGVDVNSASPALLRYVSGLNQLTARRVYEHRLQHGPFRSRQQLKEVAGFGEATFVQAAGFLKIVGGDNPLDATWIHPESYEIAARVLGRLGCTSADLAARDAAAALAERIAKIDAAALAAELQVGTMLLRDIVAQLARPGRDPREDLPPPIFKHGVLKLEDLTAGMELTGTVLNVVDFGAFVDIGMHDSGLVHVSQLADKFVRDPHDVVAVGDIVKVWVLEVDKQRRRVSLTMIPPGHERQPARRHGRPESAGRPQEARPEGRGKPPGPPPRTPAQPPSETAGAAAPPRRFDRPPSEGRPPGRPSARPEGRGPNRPPPRPRPPKPLIPLSEDMKTGKAPMRSFGDLLQFYGLQHQGPPARKDEGRKGKDPRSRNKPKPPAGKGEGEAAKPPPAEAAPSPPAETPSAPGTPGDMPAAQAGPPIPQGDSQAAAADAHPDGELLPPAIEGALSEPAPAAGEAPAAAPPPAGEDGPSASSPS